jgi:two-component system phosphate regulon sensor histidine kinase PhoR
MSIGAIPWKLIALPLLLLICGLLSAFALDQFQNRLWFEQQASEISREAHLLSRTLSVSTDRSAWTQFVQSFQRMHLGDVQIVSGAEITERERQDFVLAPIEWIREPDRFYRLRSRQPIEAPDEASVQIDQTPVDWMLVTRRVQQPQSGSILRYLFLGSVGLIAGLGLLAFRIHKEAKLDELTTTLRSIRFRSQQPIPRNEFLGLFPQAMSVDPLGREFVALCDTLHQNAFIYQSDSEPSEAIFAAMPVGILAFAPDLRLTFANRAAIRFLDLGNSIRENIPLIELIRQPKILSLVQDVQKQSASLECELETTDSVGGTVTLKIRGHSTLDSSQPSASRSVLLVISDETRLKQLENYRRDFTANVSHELKTPLSAIKAYSETLLMGAIDDPDAAVRFVTSIGEQANRLDQLIRGLMQLSRIQTMPERLELAPIYLADIVRSVVREQSTVAESNQISIINHIEEDEFADDQLTVLAEHESLRTVFGNLLSNAIRYSKKGGTVEIKTEHTPATIDLLVIDHGIGIPAEDINRIFERFYTVDKARSRDSGGTGLGLSIVKHLTAAIGGNIRVSSVLGSGSTFRVSLKRADLTPNEISAAI